MAFTDDKELRDKVIKLRYHGKSNDGDHDYLGMNSQLPSMVAASLLVKMKKVKENQIKRISIAKKYINGLRGLDIELPPLHTNGQHIYHKFVIRAKRRDELSNYLKKNGVECLIHYTKSLPELTIFKKYKTKLSVASNLKKYSLSLPIHPYLKNREIQHVLNTIKSFYKENE